MHEDSLMNHDAALTQAVSEIRISGLAYADDMAWIARNKWDLMSIMDIAHLFYRLNDIQINGSKLELIIINRPKDPDERNLKVGIDTYEALVITADSQLPVRY